MMHDWWHFGPFGGTPFLGPIFMLLIWGMVIAALVLLIKNVMRSGRNDVGSQETPRDILDRRFANGEIDKAEYEERRKALGI